MGPPELPGGNRAARHAQVRPQVIASMGPPELPGGNWFALTEQPLAVIELQWGRRNYPAETINDDYSYR